MSPIHAFHHLTNSIPPSKEVWKHFSEHTLATIEITVSGTITDESGETLIGATIMEKGTTNGRVRGIGSISAGNEPLYVIDGFPISKNVDLGVQGDNFRRGTGRFRPPTQNPLATLNPNDIESIQVLKDAASASTRLTIHKTHFS